MVEVAFTLVSAITPAASLRSLIFWSNYMESVFEIIGWHVPFQLLPDQLSRLLGLLKTPLTGQCLA